jgi:tetratricopeptide (TPR) repeat protein
MLLLTRPDKAAPKEAPKVGRIDGPSMDLLIGLVAFTLQPPVGQPSASAEEAAQLADEILRLDPTKVPYEIRAQALGIKGQWTEALRTYAEGLRSTLDRPHAEELQFLIESNPNLKVTTESARRSSPLMAEVHYGTGIRHYFDKRYDDAEKEFILAIKNDGQDARYHYFLGLARLAQGKDKANADFAEGASLEAHGRPSRAAVSTALERVQGPARTILNETRDKLR